MKNSIGWILAITILGACGSPSSDLVVEKSGIYRGEFRYGNFVDTISFKIRQDSTTWEVSFSSLEQNALGIPLREVQVIDDSIRFKLQSDFFTYSFRNQWQDQARVLSGTLTVDTLTVPYELQKANPLQLQGPRAEAVTFESNGISTQATIWHPVKANGQALVLLSSSGGADRSASRAEAILFAEKGYTTFHYDKRGTGQTAGDWVAASMEELLADDVNAIRFFVNHSQIPLSQTGIKGSSQGATKVPFLLNHLPELAYGIAVSCPGSSLLESDLNYWKNQHAKILGPDLENAAQLQKKVFEYIAGLLSKTDLKKNLRAAENQPWFNQIWVPGPDEEQTDTKLLFSPLPYFAQVQQPVLIIQGTMDEIIPPNSQELIDQALTSANNPHFKVVLLDGASHSMAQVGDTDFPYWSKLHPDYLNTMTEWIQSSSPWKK